MSSDFCHCPAAAAAGFPGSRAASEVVLAAFAILVVLVARGGITVVIAVVAASFTVSGSLLNWLTPSIATKLLAHIGSISGSIVVALNTRQRQGRPTAVTYPNRGKAISGEPFSAVRRPRRRNMSGASEPILRGPGGTCLSPD